MQNSSKVRKLIASAGALLVVGAGLTGCDAFGSGCSKGASTPEEAAETFITAAVADDAKKACSVGQKGSTVENVKRLFGILGVDGFGDRGVLKA